MKIDELERDLKDLFTEMVADEPPLGAAPVEARGSTWTFNAHRALRGTIARGFATAGLAGAVAVGALVGPRVLEDPPTETPGTLVQPGADGQTPAPTIGSTPEPAPGKTGEATVGAPGGAAANGYNDTRIGFSLSYPASWSEHKSKDAGNNYVAFVSDADAKRRYEMWQQDGACSPCPLAVPIELKNFAEHSEWVRIARDMVTRLKKEGVTARETRTTVAGRPTIAFHLAWPDRAPSDPQDQEWCRGCVGDWFLVSWYHSTTLDLRIMGLDTSSYRTHAADALALVQSVRDIGPPSERLRNETPPTASPHPSASATVAPPSNCTPRDGGSIMTSIACDAATEAAIGFASARIDGQNAEMWLSSFAKGRYDRHDSGLWLYAPSGERRYESYFITERSKENDGSVRFTIEINQGHVGDSGDRIRTEHVYIESGSVNWKNYSTPNSMTVVNAKVIAAPTEP